MADSLINLKFNATGLDKIKNAIEDIASKIRDKGIEERKSLETQGASKEELEKITKIYESLTTKARKHLEEINKFNDELSEQRSRYEDIKSISKFIQIQERLGNKEKVANLKNILTAQTEVYEEKNKELEVLYEMNKAEKELAKTREREYEENAYRRSKSNEIRDAFRNKGLFSGLKSLSFTKLKNDEFNHAIDVNDNIIRSNAREIYNIDKELDAGGLTKSDRERLEKEKERLKNDTRERQNQNAKIAKQQTMFNTTINGVKKFGQIANSVFKTMGIDLKSIMSDVFSNIKSMLSETGIASYNTGSTLFTNSTAREQQMKYGLSNSSNYALTQTMEMLNMKSDEDLMYMNQNQKEVFNELMDRYRTWYEQLESTGAMVKLQQAQLDFKMFKQELSMKLLNWFAEHKDAIFKILEMVMGFLEVIANVVEWILDLLPWGSSSSSSLISTSDVASGNTNSQININVNNTNNASANLNSKAELDNSLSAANANLVKSIAANLTSR